MRAAAPGLRFVFMDIDHGAALERVAARAEDQVAVGGEVRGAVGAGAVAEPGLEELLGVAAGKGPAIAGLTTSSTPTNSAAPTERAATAVVMLTP